MPPRPPPPKKARQLLQTDQQQAARAALDAIAMAPTSAPARAAAEAVLKANAAAAHPAKKAATAHPAKKAATAHPAKKVATAHPAKKAGTAHPAKKAATAHPAKKAVTAHPAKKTATITHPKVSPKPPNKPLPRGTAKLTPAQLAARNKKLAALAKAMGVSNAYPCSVGDATCFCKWKAAVGYFAGERPRVGQRHNHSHNRRPYRGGHHRLLSMACPLPLLPPAKLVLSRQRPCRELQLVLLVLEAGGGRLLQLPGR